MAPRVSGLVTRQKVVLLSGIENTEGSEFGREDTESYGGDAHCAVGFMNSCLQKVLLPTPKGFGSVQRKVEEAVSQQWPLQLHFKMTVVMSIIHICKKPPKYPESDEIS